MARKGRQEKEGLGTRKRKKVAEIRRQREMKRNEKGISGDKRNNSEHDYGHQNVGSDNNEWTMVQRQLFS